MDVSFPSKVGWGNRITGMSECASDRLSPARMPAVSTEPLSVIGGGRSQRDRTARAWRVDVPCADFHRMSLRTLALMREEAKCSSPVTSTLQSVGH